MPSIFPGFEYDIFISYRQNDNRSGWVSDFVTALKEELSATIKDPVSVYFDVNPNDGLLETHDVNKSLEGKLKSVILIPILSQTYCDPKSFAWEHEFCAFNKLAKSDSFGRDIRLSSGNVSSRILPVKIHELDAADQKIIEEETGGVLRSVEFIFKEPGVNRPLRPDDARADNQNHTDFRNQINKVANAVKEILSGIKNVDAIPSVSSPEPIVQPIRKSIAGKGIWIGTVAAVVLLALTYFFFFNNISSESDVEKSVAVLAFADMSPEKDQEWFSDGLSEEILNSLAKLRELKVTARTSSFYFKGKDVPLSEIASSLDVAHIVEGSVQKFGDRLRITVQLIRTSDESHIWSERYDRDYKDLFSIQTEIAQKIAQKLLTELSPESEERLTVNKPRNIEAYENYLKGYDIHHQRYYQTRAIKDFQDSERYFLRAIELDPTYADAYGALADLYDSRGGEFGYRKRDSIARVGYQLDPNSFEVLQVFGYMFLKTKHPNIDSAYHYFRKAYDMSPNHPRAISNIGFFSGRIGLLEESVKFYAASISVDPLSPASPLSMSIDLIALGRFEEAKKVLNETVQLNSEYIGAHATLVRLYVMQGDIINAKKELGIVRQLENQRELSRVSKARGNIIDAFEGKLRPGSVKIDDPYLLSVMGMKKEFLDYADSVSRVGVSSRFEEILSPTAMQNNKIFDFVRDEPRFKEIYERVEEHYQRKKRKYGNTPLMKGNDN